MAQTAVITQAISLSIEGQSTEKQASTFLSTEELKALVIGLRRNRSKSGLTMLAKFQRMLERVS